MKNTGRKYSRDRYRQLSQWGSKLDLSFSSHVLLGNKIIALDGIKKVLLVLEQHTRQDGFFIIQLMQVKTITVKKEYSSIKAEELKIKGVEEFLKAIYLQFEYRDKNETVLLPFYERGVNNVRDLAMLERNTKNWQMILSKMIVPEINATNKSKTALAVTV